LSRSLHTLLGGAVLGACFFTTQGCTELAKSLSSVKAPSVAMNRVDLLDAPTARQSAAWACYEWLDNTTCQLAGFDEKPTKNQMRFAFDLVLDLTNENEDIPIPLVELLLALTAVETENLGAVCVSFCDPDEDECVPTRNAEGACEVDEETTEVKSASDLLPTVEELVDLAEEVIDGDFDNGDFRVIQPQETLESHLQFDMNVETVFNIGEALFYEAMEDYISGSAVKINVPYTVEGTAFFDVPEMGRFAAGFGPFEDKFKIE
jgi:hypothetical protein